jgi:hypothetical protein
MMGNQGKDERLGLLEFIIIPSFFSSGRTSGDAPGFSRDGFLSHSL